MTPAATPDAIMWTTHRSDTVFTEGQGSWLRDREGKRYLDFVQGWAVNSLGHCPPQIRDALATQAARLISTSPAFHNEPAMRLAHALTTRCALDKVFFTNTGAEANEGAIKLARKWGRIHRGGAFEIITLDNSFHGRTLATMSASGKPGWDALFAPQVSGFPKAQLNDLSSVEALINTNTVAVMLEPVQGEAGVIPATHEFMRGLRELTRAHGLLLIVDEVQTGIGRCGALFAHQLSGIEPDIMTLAKGLGGGVPLGALLAREQVCCFEAGEQGGTFNGNPLMTAVGLAVLEAVAEPGFLAHVDARSAQLAEGLEALVARHGLLCERGEGLLRALVLPTDVAHDIVKHAAQRAPEGLLLNAPRPNLLRFMPALNVSEADIAQMLDMLDGLLTQVT